MPGDAERAQPVQDRRVETGRSGHRRVGVQRVRVADRR